MPTLIMIVLALAVLLISPVGAASPSPIDFDKEFSAEESAVSSPEADAFQNYLQAEKAQFSSFREKRDLAFASYLDGHWAEFSEVEGKVRSSVPKPTIIPVAVDVPPVRQPDPVVDTPEDPTFDKTPPVEIPPVPESEPEVALEPEPVVTPVLPPEQPIVEPLKPVTAPPVDGEKISLNFFGQPLDFIYSPELLGHLETLDSKGISQFWIGVSGADYPSLLAQTKQVRQQLALNDWGHYLLLQRLAAEMSHNENEAALLSWFILNKSGFDARIGFSAGRVCLLVPSRNTIFGVPYYDLKGKRYYNLSYLLNSFKPGSIQTYDRSYPGSEKAISFDLQVNPALPLSSRERDLEFQYNSSSYQLPTLVNLNRISFYNSYPDTDMQVFFSAKVDSEAAESLLTGLRPIISGKSEAEAANILLRFVQTAFAYQTDGEQFGNEKYMFVAETIYYPYSDCEDRAILYSYLVRQLLGLEVVGLVYPGHVATGVRFKEAVDGDKVSAKGKTYLVCDPTYINADIGMAMPDFKNVAPEVLAEL